MKTPQNMLSPSVTAGPFPPVLKGGVKKPMKNKYTSFLKVVAEQRTIKITALQREIKVGGGHWANMWHMLPSQGCAASASHTPGRFTAEGEGN